MGDPHVRKLPVYLPPNYSDRRKQPYPVVFLLAGWSGRGASYLNDGGAFSWSLAERLDTLSRVQKHGMSVCCGGIIGMGESLDDRCQMLITLANMAKQASIGRPH